MVFDGLTVFFIIDIFYEKLSDRRGSESLVFLFSIDFRVDVMDISFIFFKIVVSVIYIIF